MFRVPDGEGRYLDEKMARGLARGLRAAMSAAAGRARVDEMMLAARMVEATGAISGGSFPSIIRSALPDSGAATDCLLGVDLATPLASANRPGLLRRRLVFPEVIPVEYANGRVSDTQVLCFAQSEWTVERRKARGVAWRPPVAVMWHAVERAVERSGGVNGPDDMLALLDDVVGHASAWAGFMGLLPTLPSADIIAAARRTDQECALNRIVYAPAPGGALVGQAMRVRCPAMHLTAEMRDRGFRGGLRNSSVVEAVVFTTYIDEAILDPPIAEGVAHLRSVLPADWRSDPFLSGRFHDSQGGVPGRPDFLQCELPILARHFERHSNPGHLKYHLGTMESRLDVARRNPLTDGREAIPAGARILARILGVEREGEPALLATLGPKAARFLPFGSVRPPPGGIIPGLDGPGQEPGVLEGPSPGSP